MSGNIKYLKMIITAACILSVAGTRTLFAASTVNLHTTDKQRLDSLDNALPFLEDRVLSTVLFGASSPVSFTGETRLKGQNHVFDDFPDFLAGDRSRLQVLGGFRLGMVIQPGRNLTLWSKLGFTSKFPGNLMRIVDSSGLATTNSHYYSNNRPVNIFEDMCAGIAINTTPASFWLKFGSILWTEASPLTIWKEEPRSFAWDYLEYEEEQPVSEYLESNVATGEKTGRAAWRKKAFNGINLESIKLPLDLYFNLLYAKFPEYDAHEREYMDFATDLGYAAEEFDSLIVEAGFSDSYRHAFHTRLAKKIKNLTLGLNYNGIISSDDIIYAQYPYGIFFNSMFNLQYPNPLWATEYYVNPLGDSIPLDCGKGFYKEPRVFSVDLLGSIGSQVTFHTDVGFSRTDTTWVWGDTVETDRDKIPLTVKKRGHTTSDFIPAVYTNIGFDSKILSLGADLAYIKRGFYSPFSFVAPMDAFFAFGSNCLGSGTFAAKSEASPYFQNMAGAQLTVAPKIPGYGHFRVKYGQHFQPEKGRDLLFFPYRLNGMDLNTFIKSTYTMYGVGTVDYPMGGVYNQRLGDESYDPQLDMLGQPNEFAHLEESPEKGGIHADYHSMFEGFVPYDDSLQVLYNMAGRRGFIGGYREVDIGIIGKVVTADGDTIVVTNNTQQKDDNGFVPMHKKYTFNFELDAAYDIGPLIRYKNEFFLAGYVAFNSVSTAPRVFVVNDEEDEVLLWSMYLRFEPYIAVTKKFYLGLLAGYENWRSNKAWMNLADEELDNPIIKRVPINYKDAAYGIGFEWGALERMGLHGRFKWMTHKDESFTRNNYSAFLTSLEITMFF